MYYNMVNELTGDVSAPNAFFEKFNDPGMMLVSSWNVRVSGREVRAYAITVVGNLEDAYEAAFPHLDDDEICDSVIFFPILFSSPTVATKVKGSLGRILQDRHRLMPPALLDSCGPPWPLIGREGSDVAVYQEYADRYPELKTGSTSLILKKG